MCAGARVQARKPCVECVECVEFTPLYISNSIEIKRKWTWQGFDSRFDTFDSDKTASNRMGAMRRKTAKIGGEKPQSPLSMAMKRQLAEREDHARARQSSQEDGAAGMPDVEAALQRARIERAGRVAGPFSGLNGLRRAQIAVPLIERMIARDQSAVMTGQLAALEAMGAHHQEAADEIRWLHEMAQSGGIVRAIDMGGMGGGKGGMPSQPVPVGLQVETVTRACFLPWVADMTKRPPVDGKGRSLASALVVVLAAVLQGPPLLELDRLGHLRNGQARRVIRDGLSRYVTWEEIKATVRRCK